MAQHMASDESFFGAGVKATVELIPPGWKQMFVLSAVRVPACHRERCSIFENRTLWSWSVVLALTLPNPQLSSPPRLNAGRWDQRRDDGLG
eukprot:SAG11_NODE_125_length_15744_cov_50.316075_3_plen_91_part_00